MSICSDSRKARKRATAIPLVKNICSFHVPLRPASNRRDFRLGLPRYKARQHGLCCPCVPEVRRLLWQLFWQWLPTKLIFDWSYWRRRHQAIAKFYDYKRRLNQSLSYLQLYYISFLSW